MYVSPVMSGRGVKVRSLVVQTHAIFQSFDNSAGSHRNFSLKEAAKEVLEVNSMTGGPNEENLLDNRCALLLYYYDIVGKLLSGRER